MCACVCVPVNEACSKPGEVYESEQSLATKSPVRGGGRPVRGRGWGERGNVARHSAIARLLSQFNNERERERDRGKEGHRKGKRVLCFANSLCVASSLSVCPVCLCVSVGACVSRYWQLKPLVCFLVCVCGKSTKYK